MNLNADTTNPKLAFRSREVTSTVQVSAFIVAPANQVWAALRNFESKSSKSLKVLHQQSNRVLVYEINGLPRAVKRMTGRIELQPDGLGTRLLWTVSFSTKPTLFALLLRLQMRVGIGRTLREAAKNLKRRLEPT